MNQKKKTTQPIVAKKTVSGSRYHSLSVGAQKSYNKAISYLYESEEKEIERMVAISKEIANKKK